ncbi:MAG: hypothetical protein ACFCGT_27680 [Sandaracinaceae bacterium]
MRLSLFAPLALGLVGVIGAETVLLGRHPERAPAQNASTDPVPGALAIPDDQAAPEIDPVNVILARPLFAADRRPVSTTASAPVQRTPAAGASLEERYVLLGTMLGDEGNVAIVKAGSDGRLHHLGAGDRLEGWTVARVGDGMLALDRAGRSVDLGFPEPRRTLPSEPAEKVVVGRRPTRRSADSVEEPEPPRRPFRNGDID